MYCLQAPEKQLAGTGHVVEGGNAMYMQSEGNCTAKTTDGEFTPQHNKQNCTAKTTEGESTPQHKKQNCTTKTTDGESIQHKKYCANIGFLKSGFRVSAC
jgi:hypothetical protein